MSKGRSTSRRAFASTRPTVERPEGRAASARGSAERNRESFIKRVSEVAFREPLPPMGACPIGREQEEIHPRAVAHELSRPVPGLSFEQSKGRIGPSEW
jgi:hypothetical protein